MLHSIMGNQNSRLHPENFHKIIVLYHSKVKKNNTDRHHNATKSSFNKIFVKALSTQAEPVNCNFVRHLYFPLCMDKVNYLKAAWDKDKCFYIIHQVNGSQCSIFDYLTKVEPFCIGGKELYVKHESLPAVPNWDVKGLLRLFVDNKFRWMRERAIFMWPSWVEAGQMFSRTRSKYIKKKVIALIGAIGVNEWLVEWAGKGGPLGELIQWTDLITSLYMLGYDVTVAQDAAELANVLNGNEYNCATGKNDGMIDVVYTDIAGINMLKNRFGESSLSKYRCMIRILDSFGTYAEFNFPQYPHKIPGGLSGWGRHNLLLTQFLTLYPHTHDNRFLGFVASNLTKYSSTTNSKKDRALLYAKRASYIKNYETYLQIVSEYFEVHATCMNDYNLPSYIHNHGPVKGKKVQEMLSESKVFIGVGFPYEGPGPIEAMANGAVYLQPKFHIPIGKLNNDFFAGKPTLRQMTSQNPYMEEFVGEPYCYTINVTDETLLRKTLQKIKTTRALPGKIPKEFTNEGFMERVHVFTEHMDLCNPYAPRWPPIDHLQVYFSLLDESCKDTCMSKGLVCERTFFNEINKQTIIEQYSKQTCPQTKLVYFLHAPSVDSLTKICYIQEHGQMFSCMHGEKGVKRLCPCRDYEIEQTAICKNCL